MTFRTWIGWLLVTFLFASSVTYADVKVAVEHVTGEEELPHRDVPGAADNDAATKATFSIVEGYKDPASSELAVLHDGRLPSSDDQPSANFFFAPGTDGGRILVDLGSVITVSQINTYSAHPTTRGPQVYSVYAAEGTEAGFTSTLKRDQKAEELGWHFVAKVDTRSEARINSPRFGGRFGVSITDTAGTLSKARYLLFDVSRTEDRDPFGNTFFSEIDVLDVNGPKPTMAASVEVAALRFQTEDGKYRFSIDTTAAPDLGPWCEQDLKPVILAWYPKLVEMLPSEGYTAPNNVTFRFKDDMGGIPAYATGSRISLNTVWVRNELKREAPGAVVHEMVHVVQGYSRANRRADASPPPGWVVEGVADYVRWFLYEPQSKGAEITKRGLPNARYDASYRVTANFLNWVAENKDKDVLAKLNAAAREGKYRPELWKEWTGASLEELSEGWKKYLHEKVVGLR